MANSLTLEQKRTLYRDGYVVLHKAVSEELVEAALQRIRAAEQGEYIGKEKEMTDLVNASSVTPILTEAMGRFDPPIASQVGIRDVSAAPVHFSGPIAILSGPRGGSHLDQFVSMFADNGLAYIVGMPTGGYSNTWEAEEILHFPGTEQPVVRFMWNVGHTIRPNGEILEGNPPMPDAYIPLTRENFRTYHQILLEAALVELGLAAAAF